MSTTIKPTAGRVVWYHPFAHAPWAADAASDFARLGDQPLAAIIAHVWSDTCVNLVVFDSNGNAHSRTSVTLHQGDGPCTSSPWCEWMPYQKGQAAKTEAAEATALELGAAVRAADALRRP